MNRIISLLLIFSLFGLISCNSTKKQDVTQEKIEEAPIVEDDEYVRSTAAVSVSVEEFQSDKNEILRTIAKLSEIMTDYDYESWTKYIDSESIKYWSNPINLKNASKRLPKKVKGHGLANLNDYFRFVFVPSRQGRSVEEIRYISRDSVKAVQVNEDSDIVYYNFVKENGKWMVRIPPLQNQKNEE